MGTRRWEIGEKTSCNFYECRHRDNGSNDYEIMRTLVGLTLDPAIEFWRGFAPQGYHENARCAWPLSEHLFRSRYTQKKRREQVGHSCHSRALEARPEEQNEFRVLPISVQPPSVTPMLCYHSVPNQLRCPPPKPPSQ